MGCGSSRAVKVSNPIPQVREESSFYPDERPERIIPPHKLREMDVTFDDREYSEPPRPRSHASSYDRRSSLTIFEDE